VVLLAEVGVLARTYDLLCVREAGGLSKVSFGYIWWYSALIVLTLYSVKTGLAATCIYGLMNALSPAIWVGSRLGDAVI
jgi:hypothetical protein